MKSVTICIPGGVCGDLHPGWSLWRFIPGEVCNDLASVDAASSQFPKLNIWLVDKEDHHT